MRRYLLTLGLFLASVGAASAATCTWSGGTGNWDNANTASWSCGHVPTTADSVVFDGSSGGGTVTVNSPNGAGVVTVAALTMGAFTGTLDFAANDNNVTLTSSFSGTGTGARTLNMGDGTWTISGTVATPWNNATVTSFTFNANASTLIFTGTVATQRSMAMGSGLSYNIVTISANTSLGIFYLNGTTTTIATLNISAPNVVMTTNGATLTVTNAMTFTGTASNSIFLGSNSIGAAATISSANNLTCAFCAIRDLTFSGGGTGTATSSYNGGVVTGITITGPTSGGSGGGIIGG